MTSKNLPDYLRIERSLLKGLRTKFKERSTIQKSILRLEAVIRNTTPELAFIVKSNTRGTDEISPTEVRLIDSDSFIAYGLSFHLTRNAVVGGVARTENSVLFNYPEPQVFGGVQARALEAVYNGGLSYKVGNVTFADYIPAAAFRKPGQTQYSAPTAGTAEYDGSYTDGAVMAEGNPLENALAIPEFFILNGGETQDLKISFKIPPAWNAEPAAGFQHRAVLIMHGFKVTGTVSAALKQNPALLLS